MKREFAEEWMELEDKKFRLSLHQKRLEAGLTLEDMSGAAGRSAEILLQVEDLRADVTLSQIRRYAAAVGVIYSHSVSPAIYDEEILDMQAEEVVEDKSAED